MKSEYLDRRTPDERYKDVLAWLETCPGPYLFVYSDGQRDHVEEDAETWEAAQELISAALIGLGDQARSQGIHHRYIHWLERLLYAAKGEADGAGRL